MVEVHCIGGDREVKCIPCLFCIEGVSENVVGPNGDVCGMINLDQFLPLEEHRTTVMIVICDNGPPFCEGTCDVTLKQETDVEYRFGEGEDVEVGSQSPQ
jgi:hypothetical protein